MTDENRAVRLLTDDRAALLVQQPFLDPLAYLVIPTEFMPELALLVLPTVPEPFIEEITQLFKQDLPGRFAFLMGIQEYFQ